MSEVWIRQGNFVAQAFAGAAAVPLLLACLVPPASRPSGHRLR